MSPTEDTRDVGSPDDDKKHLNIPFHPAEFAWLTAMKEAKGLTWRGMLIYAAETIEDDLPAGLEPAVKSEQHGDPHAEQRADRRAEGDA